LRHWSRAIAAALAGAVAGCSPGLCVTSDGGDDPDGSGGGEDGSFNVPPGPVTTIPLTGCGGLGYAANFTMGSEVFQLTIDTGSGTLAVASSSCANCDVTPTYTPGPTATDDQKQAMDAYLKGSWQGEIYTDAVQLAGMGAVTMNFVAIGAQTGFFNDAGCGLGTVPFAPQGIAGFGPPDLARPGTDGFVTELSQAGAASDLFAFEFCSLGGQLMVGGIDPVSAALTGPAVYTPMMNAAANLGDAGGSYYSVTLNDLQLGGTPLGYSAATFGVTAVDTGTSVLALPAAVFDTLTSQIDNNSAFVSAFGSQAGLFGTTMCLSSAWTTEEIDAQLPTLTLVFPSVFGGTVAVTLKATQSYLPPTQAGETTFYCSGILSNPGPGTILGTSAMLGQLVIFNLDDNEIGFAPQNFCR